MDTFETAYARALQSGDKELVEVVRKYPTEYMAVCNKLLADGDEALALRHFEIRSEEHTSELQSRFGIRMPSSA